jgi:hypothetical protein
VSEKGRLKKGVTIHGKQSPTIAITENLCQNELRGPARQAVIPSPISMVWTVNSFLKS